MVKSQYRKDLNAPLPKNHLDALTEFREKMIKVRTKASVLNLISSHNTKAIDELNTISKVVATTIPEKVSSKRFEGANFLNDMLDKFSTDATKKIRIELELNKFKKKEPEKVEEAKKAFEEVSTKLRQIEVIVFGEEAVDDEERKLDYRVGLNRAVEGRRPGEYVKLDGLIQESKEALQRLVDKEVGAKDKYREQMATLMRSLEKSQMRVKAILGKDYGMDDKKIQKVQKRKRQE